jgi:hypothetical protein
MEFLSNIWGAVSAITLSFVAGALVGRPLFEWLRGFLPWNK